MVAVNKAQLPFVFLAGSFIAFMATAVLVEQYWLALLPFIGMLFYAGWQNINFLFFLLLATLPFSFEYNFSPGIGTDIPAELLMLLVSVVFLVYWLYSPVSVDRKIWQHPLLVLWVVVMGWMLVTVLFSTNQWVSIKYILAKGWYTGAFVLTPLIVFRKKKSIQIAAGLLFGSLLIVASIVLIRQYNNGFSFAGVNDAVAPFFRNHVNYSAMLVCIIPVLVGFFHLTKKRDLKLLLLIALLLSLVAVFFSYARGAWLALLAGMAAYWLLKKRLLFYSYIAAIILTIGLFSWLRSNDRYLQYAHDFKTTIYHRDFSAHLISTYQLKDISTAERFYRWIAGVRMIKDNSLTGFGPNTFYDNYKGYTIPAYKTWVSDNPEHSTVHNYFLLTAIEQGIPGLFLFLLLLGAMLYYAQHLFHHVTDRFYKVVAAVIGVMLTMIIVVNFLSDLIETDKIGSLFFLCLATLIAIDINNRKPKSLNSSPDIQRIS